MQLIEASRTTVTATMSARLPMILELRLKQLISWAMGEASVCILQVWFWSYQVSISSRRLSLRQSKCERNSLLLTFLLSASLNLLPWWPRLCAPIQTGSRALIQIGSQSGGIYDSYSTRCHGFMATSGCALSLNLFTDINPWPHTISITYTTWKTGMM